MYIWLKMYIWHVYWFWWDVYLTCLLILMRCIFDMYIVQLYYVFWYHVDVVVWFMYIWNVYWFWWDVYLTCLLILMRCIFDMYIIHLYYLFWYHVDVVVVWFMKCIMSTVVINIIINLYIFKSKLRCNTHVI